MSAPIEHFRHCPRCGKPNAPKPGTPLIDCPACGFFYHFNPTIAVAGILLAPDDRVLFIRRAREPARGKLALPGGFVDIGETAEDGLRREIREEVNLEVGDLEFLCSALNEYLYREVTYPVLDFVFVTRAISIERAAALDGVESLCWLQPETVDLKEIAFPSIREALRRYLEQAARRR